MVPIAMRHYPFLIFFAINLTTYRADVKFASYRTDLPGQGLRGTVVSQAADLTTPTVATTRQFPLQIPPSCLALVPEHPVLRQSTSVRRCRLGRFEPGTTVTCRYSTGFAGVPFKCRLTLSSFFTRKVFLDMSNT